LRACKVKRGIGTIRQDVNISIKGSERVEIKGFQDPGIMNLTVIKEIKRQQLCIIENSCKKEVRKVNPDGSTEFIRPMPGSARMYPETDCELLKITEAMIDEAKKTLPKLASENKSFLEEFGLNEELIKLILSNKKLEEFKYLTKVITNPQLIAKSLILFPKEIASKEKKNLAEVEKILQLEVIENVLLEVGKRISENDVKLVLQKIVMGEKFEEAITKEKIDLDKEIKNLIKEKPNLNVNSYMGLIMGKFKGRINGKEIMDLLNKNLK
jgi:glutamyl-tRNA(Gln) amidotransferase subunit E